MFTLNSEVVFREEGEHGGILFNPKTGETVGLNPVAAAIYQGLLDGLERDGILAQLEELCDEVSDSLGSDVDEFLQTLKERGFLL